MNNRIEISLPEQPAAADLADRLVTLSDGRHGVRSTMQVEISEPDLGRTLAYSGGEGRGEEASISATQPILDFIASDETLDRCGEIIAADGWRLESYRRNPVFQNAHQYGDIIFTLGRALITEVRYGTPREAPREPSTIHSPPSAYLFQRIQFATEANPMARIAYALYKGKFLNAVSVGFIPLRWVDADGSEQDSASRGRAASERVPGPDSLSPPRGERVGERGHESTGDNSGPPLPSDGRGVRGEGPFRRYLEQELLEVSAVGIPANPNALQLGLKAGAIQKSDLQELLDLLRSLCASKSGVTPQLSTINYQPIFDSHSAVPNTLAGASGVRSYEAQWLQLARAIRDVMREPQNLSGEM